jgi:hypothetical protein
MSIDSGRTGDKIARIERTRSKPIVARADLDDVDSNDEVSDRIRVRRNRPAKDTPMQRELLWSSREARGSAGTDDHVVVANSLRSGVSDTIVHGHGCHQCPPSKRNQAHDSVMHTTGYLERLRDRTDSAVRNFCAGDMTLLRHTNIE